jgi:hypothetical protein
LGSVSLKVKCIIFGKDLSVSINSARRLLSTTMTYSFTVGWLCMCACIHRCVHEKL